MNNFTILHLSDLHFDVNNDETITDLHTRLLNDIQLEMQYSDNIIIINKANPIKNKTFLLVIRILFLLIKNKIIVKREI